MIEAMVDRRMDGLVLIAPFGAAEELETIARGTPTVVLGRHGPARAFDTVASDDIAGSALIVDHLASLGHRSIVHLSNVAEGKNEPGMPQEVRARGYLQAMERHGLEPDVIVAPWSHQGGLKAGAEILSRDVLPSAVHGGADVAALGLLTELWNAGVQVPGEISVAGYDNIFMGSLAPVGLTTVDQSGFEMGATAAKLLMERIQGRKESLSVLVPPRLMVRKTTGPFTG
jgi:LacI family transcriptional regulator